MSKGKTVFLSKFALKYPVTILMVTLAVIILGLTSARFLTIDLLPDIQFPRISVITTYPGAGPADIERTITIPVERAVSAINNLTYVTSASREGISLVTLNFNFGTDLAAAQVDVIQRVNRILDLLPEGTNYPVVARFSTADFPVINLAIYSDRLSSRELYDLSNNFVEQQFAHLQDVASAQTQGGDLREIHVFLDRAKLQSRGLAVDQVMAAVRNANLTLPSGTLKTGSLDYMLLTNSRMTDVRQLEDIIVGRAAGVPVYLRDVASVDDSIVEQTNVLHINGKPGVMLAVYKASGANTVAVVDRVKAQIPVVQRLLPDGTTIQYMWDQSSYIRNAITTLQHEALIGAVLAMLVILIFLRNLRSTLIISLAIPISFIATLILLYFGNLTLNIMTFGGLALGIGRLVDDAIVVLENIFRHLNRGDSRFESVVNGTREVAAPVLSATITTIVVFLPVAFVTGIGGILFRQMALTVAFSLVASYFVALTVIPALAFRFLRPEEEIPPLAFRNLKQRLAAWSRERFERVDEGYQRLLEWALSHRRQVVFGVSGIFLLSLGLVPITGTEFFPSTDEGQIRIMLRLPVGTRLEETLRVTRQVERLIEENVPEKATVFANAGARTAGLAALFNQNTGPHAAQMAIRLVPVAQRRRSQEQVMNDLRPKLSDIPGAQVFLSGGGLMSFLVNFGAEAPISVEIRGYDLDEGARLAQQTVASLQGVEGLKDLQVSRESNFPQLRIDVDRQRAGLLGLTMGQITQTIQAAISGSRASAYTDPGSGNEYDIQVRFRPEDRQHLEDLNRIFLQPPGSGPPVLLSNVARVHRTAGPLQIDRKYQERIITVTANTTGRDFGSIAREVEARLADIPVPGGFSVALKGAREQQQQTFAGLLFALILAIILVYMVMASQFQSLLDPFVVMFSVPLGLIGVLWVLFLSHTSLSVVAFIGVIMMVGIVVSNGILLVDYTNQMREAGMDLRNAVILAGRTRLRPILMTSLATVLALIPMAIGLGEGAETNAPLAIAVIGGLAVSTALTLLLIPTLYTILEDRVRKNHGPGGYLE